MNKPAFPYLRLITGFKFLPQSFVIFNGLQKNTKGIEKTPNTIPLTTHSTTSAPLCFATERQTSIEAAVVKTYPKSQISIYLPRPPTVNFTLFDENMPVLTQVQAKFNAQNIKTTTILRF